MDYDSDMDSDEYNELVEAEAEEVRLNAEAEAAAKDGATTINRRYITACRPDNHTEAKVLEFLCSYLAELSLLDYGCTRFKPSVVAAACLFVARFIIRPNTYPWNPTLQRYTDYTISDLNLCILRIHDLQLKSRFMAEQSIHDKYNCDDLEWVSEMVSPKDIPGHFLVD